MIFYNGPSVLDGNPIVGILTGYNKKGSANAKTGRMLQTWILRSDIHPSVAAKSGDDFSICGNCKLRADPTTGRARRCYVVTAYGPAAVYRAYKASRYIEYSESVLSSRLSQLDRVALRMGSYGDPAAIPQSAWENLLRRCDNHTGYTHQWRSNSARWLQGLVMASVDSVAEYIEATSLGWKCFLVHNHKDLRTRELALAHGVKLCPSSKEWVDSGKKHVSCEKCLACDGTKGSRIIAGHGSSKNRIGLAVI